MLLGISSGGLSAQSPVADTDLEQARNNLNQVKSRIAAISKRLRRQDSTRDSIARDLEESERKAAQLVLEGRRLEKVRTRLNTSLHELSDSASRLRQRRQLLQLQLARQVRVAYALGRESRLKLALNGQQPGDLPRMLRYHDYFALARSSRIAQLNTAHQRLHQTLDDIQVQNTQLANLAERQQRQIQELAGERKLRAAALGQLERELKDQRKRLAALKQNERRLADLLKALRQAINEIPPELEPPKSFHSLRGKLPWPVTGKRVRGNLKQGPSGTRRSQNIILRARAGVEVRAIAHGRVIFADWLRGFGQMIIIDHGGNYMSLYGYNQSLLREPGEWVGKGDSIATVGDSGGQAKTGLYFEIRRAGQPLDPTRWCSSRAQFKSTAL